jgi:nucleoid-associated protein YgaU
MDLGKMYGPLPLGAWVAAIGGGLGIMVYTKRQSASTAAATAGSVPLTDANGNPIDTSGGVGAGGSGQWTDLTTPTNTSVAPTPTTNDEWQVAAINYLIASGYNPTQADAAIRAYASGATPTISQWALVNAALAKLGSLPQPLPSTGATPPTTPTTDTTSVQYVRVLGSPQINPVTGFRIENGGALVLSYDDWKRLGKPKFKYITPLSPLYGLCIAAARSHVMANPAYALAAVNTHPLQAVNPGPVMAMRNPGGIRYYTSTVGDSLANIALTAYGNPARASDIFNANRSGVVRSDNTAGVLDNMSTLSPGTQLVIPQ